MDKDKEFTIWSKLKSIKEKVDDLMEDLEETRKPDETCCEMPKEINSIDVGVDIVNEVFAKSKNFALNTNSESEGKDE